MKRFLLGTSLVLAIGVAPIACNVFVSLERCSSDADCPQPYAQCDLEFAFCKRRPDAATDAPVSEAGGDVVQEAAVDAGPDADADASQPCNLGAPFGSLKLVSGFEGVEIGSARLTSDEKSVIFSAYTGCQIESCIDLYLAKRDTPASPFVTSGLLPGVNTQAASEYWPTFGDGFLIFFESGRSLEKVNGNYVTDRSRIWSATRPTLLAQFSEPYIQDIFKVDAGVVESSPYLHPSSKVLYFASNGRAGKGGFDIFTAALDTSPGGFGSALSITNVDSVNTTGSELMPIISFDERALYFAREEVTGHVIMVARREGATGPFGAAMPIGELNGFDPMGASPPYPDQWPSWLSDDECRMYFISNRPHPIDPDASPPKFRLWMAEHPK